MSQKKKPRKCGDMERCKARKKTATRGRGGILCATEEAGGLNREDVNIFIDLETCELWAA